MSHDLFKQENEFMVNFWSWKRDVLKITGLLWSSKNLLLLVSLGSFILGQGAGNGRGESCECPLLDAHLRNGDIAANNEFKRGHQVILCPWAWNCSLLMPCTQLCYKSFGIRCFVWKNLLWSFNSHLSLSNTNTGCLVCPILSCGSVALINP